MVRTINNTGKKLIINTDGYTSNFSDGILVYNPSTESINYTDIPSQDVQLVTGTIYTFTSNTPIEILPDKFGTFNISLRSIVAGGPTFSTHIKKISAATNIPGLITIESVDSTLGTKMEISWLTDSGISINKYNAVNNNFDDGDYEVSVYGR